MLEITQLGGSMFKSTSFGTWSALCVVVFGLTGCAALADKWANEEREIVQRQLKVLEEVESKASREEEAGSRAEASHEGVTNSDKAIEDKKLTETPKPKDKKRK